MDLNLQLLMPWLAAIIAIANAGTSFYRWMNKPADRNAEILAEVNARQLAFDRRLQAIEDELKHRPDVESIHKIELLLERMTGRLDSIDGRFDTFDEKLKPIKAATERMNEVLLLGAHK
ncbi:DUF2730 domain-containing protein [Brucella anthropi]|uniref:DUF2730 domain-containing protein n=1 Tax=Brucella anthropi TaxID=529 RepID=UPI00235DCC5C|nr:DUF2730 domain-containing protein [Brucella anthropi]